MRRLVLGLMAAAALGAALPAAAHEYENPRPVSDWVYGSSYGEFSDDIEHLKDGIRHGLSDGSYDREEARRFYSEVRRIERMAYRFYATGGYSSWERAQIQRRIDNLHAIMHEAHEEGHEQQDDGYYSPYNPYNR
jgi:hypothetical protein